MKKHTFCKVAGLTALLALTSCGKKEAVSAFTIEIDMLSYEAEYHPDPSGTYQLSSNKTKIRSQVWTDGVKDNDETETDEELPDKSAGEFDSMSFKWKDDQTIEVREFYQESMDDILPDAPPLIFDDVYELEITSGSKADFEAGRAISVQYTAASLAQLEKDLVKEIDAYFVQLAPIILKQAAGGAIDMSSSRIESEVEAVSINNVPSEFSKGKFQINTDDFANIRMKWSLYLTQ